MADYDAIIIGAGNNGLVCAMYLANAGWRVLLIEQASEIGGAAQTGEVTLPGFKHDLFATNFTSFTLSPAYRDYQRALEGLGVRFVYNNSPYASVYSDADCARVYRDLEMTEREMARHSTDDLAGWQAAVKFFTRIAPTVLPLHFTELPSLAMSRQFARIIARNGLDLIGIARLIVETPRQFVNRYFATSQVKGLFTPWAFHLDYGPDVRGGAMFSFVAAISAHLRGLNVVEGGASRLITALRTLIERKGGQIRTLTRAAAVEISDGTAVGVVTDGRESVSAKTVIANLAPQCLFGTLIPLDCLPSGFCRRMSRFRHAVGTFVLHLALADPLAWKASPELADFSYVHVCGTADEIANAYGAALAGLIPARPMLIVSQPSKADPTRAPPGKCVARIHARAFPKEIVGDEFGTIRERDWDSIKERVADRLIDILVEYAPNVRRVLLHRYSVSPLDLERANPNLINGDCNGGSHHLDQYYLAPPALGWSRYRTPIKNLYMIGASQWPGSGVNGASGYLLARQLLR